MNELFVFQSFYLPGSVDIYDKQIEDWNKTPPVLYLWSSRDWAPKHRAIAEKHNHRSGGLRNYISDKTDGELHITNPAPEFDDRTSSGRGEDKHADMPSNLKQKGNEITSQGEGQDKETMDHHEELAPKYLEHKEETMSHSSEAGKSFGAVKNQWESNSKRFGGGTGNRKRPASDVFHKDVPSSTYPPTQHGETTFQFQSERGGYSHSREVARFHSERDGHQQLSHSREMSLVPYDGGGGGYQYPRQSNFSPHQSTYARAVYNEEEHDMNNLVAKYCGNDHEQLPLQAYGQRGNHDYPFPAAPSMNNNWTREVSVPPPYQDAAYPPHYGLRSIAPTSSYGEMRTPASQRYASRLHEPEPIHMRMDPMLTSPAHFPPNRGQPHEPPIHVSLGFARGPYNPPPDQFSTGWLND